MLTQGYIIFNKSSPVTNFKQDAEPISNSPIMEKVLGNSNHKRLGEMADRSQRVLMRISSKRPFDLFPDSLIIDENKISLVHREFGLTDVHIVFIENISYVTINTSLVAATLSITDSTSERFPQILSVQWLKKEEAVKARKLIHGLMAAKKVGINFAEFNAYELVSECERLGEVKGAD
jgi:hypothetical protein